MTHAATIRALRKQRRMTQSTLSQLSGVSLPYLQRIEYGTTHPSYETLQALFNVFHMELQLTRKPINFAHLAAIGVPISNDKKAAMALNKEVVAQIILGTCSALSEGEIDLRLRLAVESWLLAVKLDYPTYFKNYLQNEITEKIFPKQITGQHIKLRRIALDRVAKFL